MKHTDLIFCSLQIDCGFSSDRCINHRKQGRRKLNEVCAAAIKGGGKTCDVAYKTSAERNEQIRTRHFLFVKKIEKRIKRSHRFMIFAGCEHKSVNGESRVFKDALDTFHVQRRNDTVRNQRQRAPLVSVEQRGE